MTFNELSIIALRKGRGRICMVSSRNLSLTSKSPMTFLGVPEYTGTRL